MSDEERRKNVEEKRGGRAEDGIWVVNGRERKGREEKGKGKIEWVGR